MTPPFSPRFPPQVAEAILTNGRSLTGPQKSAPEWMPTAPYDILSEKRGLALESFINPDELLDQLYAIESEWIKQSLRELEESRREKRPATLGSSYSGFKA